MSSARWHGGAVLVAGCCSRPGAANTTSHAGAHLHRKARRAARADRRRNSVRLIIGAAPATRCSATQRRSSAAAAGTWRAALAPAGGGSRKPARSSCSASSLLHWRPSAPRGRIGIARAPPNPPHPMPRQAVWGPIAADLVFVGWAEDQLTAVGGGRRRAHPPAQPRQPTPQRRRARAACKPLVSCWPVHHFTFAQAQHALV